MIRAAAQAARTRSHCCYRSALLPDVADGGGVRARKRAIGSDSRDIVELLLADGAEIDRPSKHYGGGMGFAAHFARKQLAERMAPYSRDVHNLANIGMKSRLIELFSEEPDLTTFVHPRGGVTTMPAPPEDETLRHRDSDAAARARRGSRFRNRDGLTATDMAARYGLLNVADLLETGL